MKRLFFGAFGVLLCFAVLCARGEENKLLLHQADAYLGAGTNQWWLPVSRIAQLPIWKGEGEPPISTKRALKIARKWIASKSGNGEVNRIILRPINADESESKYRHSFYYIIEFRVNPFGNHITCVVLMDGTVLEPLKI